MSQSSPAESVASQILSHPNQNASVQFDWNADRFDHTIHSESNILKSIVQSNDPAWPASPPIQQLSIESIEEREVALGVGCAGSSHWSLSVEPTETGFRFDWACRSKETPLWLGTTYERRAPFELDTESASQKKTTDDREEVVPTAPLVKADTIRWSYEVRVVR